MSLVIVLLSTLIHTGHSVCYFPIEYQGIYLSQTQSGIGPSGNDPIQYQPISIEVDQITPWGRCHEMFGSNVILWDSFRGADCMRCFHLSRKSPNVIQIYTEGFARCYTNIAAAKATCPGEDRPLDLRSAQEITVYRTAGPAGTSVEPVYCAINGKFKFTYSANNGQYTCPRSVSQLSNCPFGMGLNVKFTECSFEDLELNFQCLGDWAGLNGKRYLALLDTRLKTQLRPKYRCAIYEKDELTGDISLSLSEDSTCKNNLISATEGFERLTLKPVPSLSWPTRVQESSCQFPSWAQGEWHNMNVINNEITFEDHTKFKTSRMRCISELSNDTHTIFHVYSITHCGEESELCLLIKQRSPNVVEILFGDNPITEEMLQRGVHNTQGHCWGRFGHNAWITQAKRKDFVPTACPIEGDYTGVVPGAPGLCAKIASDCNNPEIMFYTVSSCANRSHMFEDRINDGYGRPSQGHPSDGRFIRPPDYIGVHEPMGDLSNVIKPQRWIQRPIGNDFNKFKGGGTGAGQPTNHVPDRFRRPPFIRGHRWKPPDYGPSAIGRPPNSWNKDSNARPPGDGGYQHRNRQGPNLNFGNRNRFKPPGFYGPAGNGNPTRFGGGYRSQINRNWPTTRDDRQRPRGFAGNGYDGRRGHGSAIVIDRPSVFKGTGQVQQSSSDNAMTNLHGSIYVRGGRRTTTTGHRRQSGRDNVPNRIMLNSDQIIRVRPSRSKRDIPSNKREYQCLGQWEENGVLFTYTQRRDIQGFFCFAGVVRSGSQVHIKEAGKNCERGENPELYGMKLIRQSLCNRLKPPTLPPRRPWPPQHPNVTPRRPWQPFPRPTNNPNAWPPNNNNNNNNNNRRRPQKPEYISTTPRSWYPITASPTKKSGSLGHRVSSSRTSTVITSTLVIVFLAKFRQL